MTHKDSLLQSSKKSTGNY